jgi:hypothetical protein
MGKITNMWKKLAAVSKPCHFDMVLYKDPGHSSHQDHFNDMYVQKPSIIHCWSVHSKNLQKCIS